MNNWPGLGPRPRSQGDRTVKAGVGCAVVAWLLSVLVSLGLVVAVVVVVWHFVSRYW